MMTNSLRIIYMGTPDFAVPALHTLHKSNHDIICVYTQPPRPKGRGHKLQRSPVHEYAESHHIPVRTPIHFKDTASQTDLKDLQADIAIVAAYGLILPKAVLKAPQYGCLNIHASLLPRWRGASPIQHAIWKGDRETGITIMQMDEGLDTGDMIAHRAIPIHEDTTAQTLHDDLANLSTQMILQIIDEIATSKTRATAAPQDNSQTTYAPLLTKEDGRINWSQTAREIDCQIRALTPWPGVFAMANNKRIKIKTATTTNKPVDTNEPVGTLLNKHGDIACGSHSILKVTNVQPDNAKPMDIASAINGNYLHIGEQLK